MSNPRPRLLKEPSSAAAAAARPQQQQPPPQTGYYVYYENMAPVRSDGWGCMWIMFFVIVVFFIAGIFIVWYVPPPGSARIPANTPMAHSSTSGMVIPALGNVDMSSSSSSVSLPSSSCGGVTWDIYNTTTHLCRPRLGALDSELFDRTVNPCDSFYQHTCGAWLAHYKPMVDAEQTPRRVDRSFGYVQRYNAHVLTKIIESHVGGPVFNFYSSCVNAHVHKQQEAQQKAYRDHLLQELAFDDIHKLPSIFAKLLLMGFTAPISLSMEVHPMEPKVVPLWAHDGFSVSAESAREMFAQIIADPKALDQRVEDFITLHQQIEQHRPKNEPQTMEQFMTYLEGTAIQDFCYVDDIHRLMRASTAFSPTLLMQELKLTIPSYHTAWIRDKAYYAWLFSRDGPIQSLTLRQWQAYVQFSILYGSKDFFPKLPNALFIPAGGAGGNAGSGSAAAGNTKNIGAVSEGEGDSVLGSVPTMKRAVAQITHDHCKRMTEMLLPGYVSKEYLQMSCPDSLQARVVDVAKRVRDALAGMVAQSSYMLAEDKRKTLEKLAAIVVRVGQPNAWDVEPFGWELAAGDYMKNLDHIRRYRVQKNFARFRGGSATLSMDTGGDNARLDRDALAGFQSPLSLVNAMYSPTSNTISIYAGILQYPFVDAAYDNVTLFATIGSVIGHELAHSLDPAGRRFDAEGMFRRGRLAWWQRATVMEYDKRMQCIVDDFGSKAPSCISAAEYGRHTITEDAADVMGVNAAYLALKSAAGGGAFERGDKMRFFYSFSQMWCSVANQLYDCTRAVSDVHAVPRVRVDSTLRNLQAFQEAFSCPGGTYMTKEQRCDVF